MIEKFYSIGKNILILFLIIYIGSLIAWVFNPIRVAFQTLFVPLILAGLLFYLLRPFVNLLNKKMPRGISILMIYLLFLGIIILSLALVGPVLQSQVMGLANNIPQIVEGIQEWFLEIDLFNRISQLQQEEFLDIDGYIDSAMETLNNWGRGVLTGMGSFIGSVASAVFTLILLPIVLFYVLKDSKKFQDIFVKMFQQNQQSEVREVLKDVDRALSSYIQGQGLVCLFVGILCLIAFLIIGLDYALLLAIIAGLTNIIPFFGPWIGSVPAVIVALFLSPLTALFTVLAIIIIQQIESNLISPQIIGKKLNLHPLVIIFLILIAGQLVGLIGMIFVVPLFASVRVLFTHGRKIWKIKKNPIKKFPGYEE
ncbi:AI-2E family transporter [Isachenkonia alkalipeptolytica]|uniref:AI-2E family transporter n=1 Tax=Isachenkonia alkalipeptolytica TaxID=2565777 RepID=A0AA43XLI6_9CLOT|nr:AI-2E family transporter [Isachenkonia alkalipeptolytica]NBG88459.1 AI-2E family transporter [Isachenkonia alkalipeptolytica]